LEANIILFYDAGKGYSGSAMGVDGRGATWDAGTGSKHPEMEKEIKAISED
jgi:hypothetical protein